MRRLYAYPLVLALVIGCAGESKPTTTVTGVVKSVEWQCGKSAYLIVTFEDGTRPCFYVIDSTLPLVAQIKPNKTYTLEYAGGGTLKSVTEVK